MSLAALRRLRAQISRDGMAIVPLRWMIGFGFAAHGYAKLARGPQSFVAVLTALGTPAPALGAWLTIFLELFGGIALMLGAFVTPLSLPLAVIMLTALFSVHLPYGFSSIKLLGIDQAGAHFGPTGYEINLLYLAGLLTLVLSGPGPLSIDRWFAARGRLRRAAARQFVGGGVTLR